MYVLSKRHFLKNVAIRTFLPSYLSANLIKAPAGEKNFYPSSGFAPASNIVKINIANNKIYKIILDQGKELRYDVNSLK